MVSPCVASFIGDQCVGLSLFSTAKTWIRLRSAAAAAAVATRTTIAFIAPVMQIAAAEAKLLIM